MPPFRTRLAIGLISAGVIVLELALMRAMSLRFWHHFAQMIVSVALLGFGASGTALTLLRRPVSRHPRGWLIAAAVAFALAAAACPFASRLIAVDAQFLAWDPTQLAAAAGLELVMLLPFFFAAGAVAIALTDRPQRIAGHYAASLAGSGLGAIGGVAMMGFLTTGQLMLVPAAAGALAGIVLAPFRRPILAAGPVMAGLAVAGVGALAPYRPEVSQYKMLSLVEAMPDTRVIDRREGPLGRIDVVAGPAIHYAPGLSLQYTGPVPPHVLMITDGDGVSAVYDARRRDDWAFLDHTTAAVGYHLRRRPRTLILGAGGGSDIGLALYHGCRDVVALEMNGQVIEAMTGPPLAGLGGRVYRAPGVSVVNAEARGYLAGCRRTFDLIQLPALDAFGASGAGLYASQESYLYTVEAFGAMLDRLAPGGLLCVTRWARTPPRDALRVLDTAAEALRRRGLAPARHLAMIRSWATVTVVASPSALTAEDARGVRRFCDGRSFDLCWLEGMRAGEANRFHVLDRPYYFEAAGALLGPGRRQYLADYLFDVAAATDDRPYFHHFFRWRSLAQLSEQLGRRSRAFLELGYLMLLAALAQAVVLGAAMIVLPLAPGIRSLKGAAGKAPALGYFLLLGAGFMLLEMGFLQKLILYLAHPVYSAAVVIAGFLIFAALGSRLSQRWLRPGTALPGATPTSPARVAGIAAAAVVGLSLATLAVVEGPLAWTQGWPLGLRFVVAGAAIAPLATAMGHLFPAGLRQVADASPALVPWAWAVNGFASVVATVAAAVLAMSVGFLRLMLLATACYALAGLLARWLPRRPRTEEGVHE